MSLPHKRLDLDLLPYSKRIKIKKDAEKTYVWDPIRKQYFVLLPEEMVRQSLLLYLIESGFSKRLISVEKQIKLGQQTKRYDILVYRRADEPLILIECKKPDLDINQSTFDQISMYNLNLKIPYLMVSNGRDTYLSQIDFVKKKFTFVDRLPELNTMSTSELRWNYSEFLTFVLIHAGFADLELTQDEKAMIQDRFGKEMFDSILKEYDEMGDYERLEEIMKYKGVYFPTAERKMEILSEMKKVFEADGLFSKLEVNLLDFLDHML